MVLGFEPARSPGVAASRIAQEPAKAVDNHSVTAATTPGVDGDSRTHPKRIESIWMLGCIVVLAMLYAWQLQPGIAPHGDISKFQFVGPTGGTAHQTGYPLYLALTWLVSHIAPFAGTGTAVTAVSAIAMVGAAALCFAALRHLGARPVIAATFAIVLGAAPYPLYYAVVAELYALHLLFMSALLVALLRWQRTRSDVHLGIAVLLLALSFTHHMTTALLVPGIAVFVWMVDRRTFQRRRVWLLGAAALAMAALSYGFLIWRAADQSVPFLEVVPRSWRDLPGIWLGTGAAGSFTLDPGLLAGRAPAVGLDVVRSTLLTLPLALFGARRLGASAAGIMLGLWALAVGVFALALQIPDIAGFLIPVVLVIVVAAALGMERIASRYLSSPGLLTPTLGLVAIAAVVMGVAFVEVQAHDEYAARTRSWLDDVPTGAVLAADYPDAMAVFHLAILEDTRTDVVVVSNYPLADPRASVIGRYLVGETVEVPHTRQLLRPGRAVYAAGREWACELAAAGFAIDHVTEDLFRVLAYDGTRTDLEGWCGD